MPSVADGESVFVVVERSSGMIKSYDVIVVGARCGGSPTAMLLARSAGPADCGS